MRVCCPDSVGFSNAAESLLRDADIWMLFSGLLVNEAQLVHNTAAYWTVLCDEPDRSPEDFWIFIYVASVSELFAAC